MSKELLIDIYDGEIKSVVRMCSIEGRVEPFGRPPYPALEEALRLLELREDKYITPHPESGLLSALIGRKGGDNITLSARLEIAFRERGISTYALHCDGRIFEGHWRSAKLTTPSAWCARY
jgi:hypothetical protein